MMGAGLILLAIALGAGACRGTTGGSAALETGSAGRAAPTMTPLPPTETATTLPMEMPSPAATFTPTPSATAAPTATETPTATVTPAPSATPTASPTATPTPGPTPDGTARSIRAPILMYHHIEAPPPAADAVRRDLSVTPDRFESHLKYLQTAGYHVITLDDLLDYLAQGRPLPEKPVILTFDDGYSDNYTAAFPLLTRYGMTGHFFIITDFVNAGQPDYMNWAQIEAMAAAGQRFGSHSRNHPDLRGKSVDYLVWQALGGTEALQAHLGYHPRWITYPSGGYDDQAIAVFKSAHYWGGLTTQQGATHTLEGIFTLKRVRVRGSHTAEDLARLLELDW